MTAAGAAIAAYGLPTEHTLDAVTDDFAALVQECEHERLTGLLGRAVRAGDVDVTVDERDQLEHVFRGWLTHALRVERLLLDTTRVLDRAGIESRVLKGVALSHTAYPDPADRVFGDVDLLVPGHRLHESAAVLADHFEVVRVQPELRRGFDDRFGKEVMLRVGAVELDVHRTFVEGAFGMTVGLDDLFAPPYRFPIAGCDLDALPQPQRLLHACYAAAFGDWPPRLMSLRDVAQLVLRERPQVLDVLMMARAWRAEAVVARALTTAWTTLAITMQPPVVEWAFRYEPTRLDRLLLGAHEGPARAFTRHAAALVVLPSARDRLDYLHAIAMPQREYLQARGMSLTSHLGRTWRRLVG
jgi:hypothetical protein